MTEWHRSMQFAPEILNEFLTERPFCISIFYRKKF